jgi:transcriptional regulator with XRE-family HTH domain
MYAEALKDRLSYNIKRIRKMQKLSQEQLAEKANVSKDTINSIESRRVWPSDKTLSLICSALDCDVFSLFLPSESIPEGDNKIYADIKQSVTLHIKELINETLDKVIEE